MQNLHLKNLQNSTTLDYLITELKKINIIDPKINDFRNSYLTNIKQNTIKLIIEYKKQYN